MGGNPDRSAPRCADRGGRDCADHEAETETDYAAINVRDPRTEHDVERPTAQKRSG